MKIHISLPGLVLVLALLKLTHVIEWSWWWVTAPVWGPVALVISITIGVIVLAGSFAALSEWFENQRRGAPSPGAPRLK